MPRMALLAALFTVACGDPGVSSPLSGASLSVVSGSAQVDTIDVILDPIILQVTNDADGSGIAGVRIESSLAEPSCGVVSLEASTGPNGRVSGSWILGGVARVCSLVVQVLDSNGTPRLSATVPATILPGVPTALDLGDLPVWVYVGERHVAGTLPAIHLLAADRRGNSVPDPDVVWSFAGGIDVDGDTIHPTREGKGWMTASVSAARDSVELWALNDLGKR